MARLQGPSGHYVYWHVALPDGEDQVSPKVSKLACRPTLTSAGQLSRKRGPTHPIGETPSLP